MAISFGGDAMKLVLYVNEERWISLSNDEQIFLAKLAIDCYLDEVGDEIKKLENKAMADEFYSRKAAIEQAINFLENEGQNDFHLSIGKSNNA